MTPPAAARCRGDAAQALEPKKHVPARGLIMTLSNSAGAHFTPASAPVVLLRMMSKTPRLGFIRPDSPDYETYRKELEAVMPGFGLFATTPPSISGSEAEAAKPKPLDPSSLRPRP
jgi:hypothetical protein